MRGKIAIFILFFLAGFISEVRGDTVYLKNGRNIEGLIKKESEESLELDVGFGTVKFRKQEIKNIRRSSADEAGTIRKEWQIERKLEEEKRLKREAELEVARRKRALEPKEVGISQVGDRIAVKALLNKKVTATLFLDTGASVILLSGRIAKKLGIKSGKEEGKSIKVQMADGREVDAKYVILDSVNVEGVEARNVGAVILSDDGRKNAHDGLLGMSFLNKFNFQIDTVNKKLVLKKLSHR